MYKTYKDLGFEDWKAVVGPSGEPSFGSVLFPFLTSFPICQIKDLFSLVCSLMLVGSAFQTFKMKQGMC